MRAAARGGADQGDGGIVLGRDDIEEALDQDRSQPRLGQGRSPPSRQQWAPADGAAAGAGDRAG